MSEDRKIRLAAEGCSAHPEAAGVVPGGVGGGVPIAPYIVLVLPRLIADHGVGGYPVIVSHVNQGSGVAVPGLVGEGRSRVLVEAIIGDQAGFIPGEVPAHVLADLFLSTGNVPDTELVNLAIQRSFIQAGVIRREHVAHGKVIIGGKRSTDGRIIQ